MDKTHKSNETSEHKIKSDTLDQLYKEQLTDLRDLIFKKAEAGDIEICRKWLKGFNRTTKAEKMARNCLCTLMQQQIRENNCLGEPFTNLQNCNRNLECILRELDDGSNQTSNESFPSERNITFNSHCFNPSNNDENQYEPPQCNGMECQQNPFNTETIKLRQELECLRLQLTEKEIENIKLKEITEKYHLKNKDLEEKFDNIKSALLNDIREKLLDLVQSGMFRPQIKIFEYIFQHFSIDEEFMGILRKYDIDFHQILSEHFEREFSKRKTLIARHLCRKFVKTKSKMREKYERRLMMQSQAQKLQIKLAKLKCFSALRQIFINSSSEFGEIEMWQILKIIEEKYQSVANYDDPK